MPHKYFLTFAVDITLFLPQTDSLILHFKTVDPAKNEHKSNPVSGHRPTEVNGPAEHVF